MPLLKIINVSERTGCPWFRAAAMFLHCKNSPSTNVYGCTFVDEVSTPSIFKRLTLQNRHGWRWFQAEASSHCELVVEQCTRKYTVQQAISKGLRKDWF
ncbi:MAG: hypothetical protein ACFNYQ_02355 [Treponema sp.]|uniref:hypothetical protein n=1 Tax=Treponema sp. TaxID=166 RepID=UPI00360E418F